jgi:hypothetical protein
VSPAAAHPKKKPSRSASPHFVFKRHANIGAADAIEDKKYLGVSFIDTGELEIVTDLTQPQCIVLGRTGSGKTALLERLFSTKDKVITIAPEGLALTFVADSDVLGFFAAAGVKMDLFYRLLWRHVFAVEIIREHFHIINEQSRDSFLIKIRDRILRHKSRQNAIDYLLKWGESFWKDSEYRVQEVTKTLEQELGSSIGAGIDGAISPTLKAGVKLSAEAARRLTESEKAEVVSRGQSVVDKVQMKTLSDIMDMLEIDILEDKQKKYYITIDRLDEDWVQDDLRYHLVKALFDTVRDFNSKIRNVKIIVSIREDLLERVFRRTRTEGYQGEKYKSMYLRLTWNETDLEALLDRRVSQLVREQYTKNPVSLRSLLPASINQQDPVKFILDRTLMRPRDAIMFFNECIAAAEGKPKITQAMVVQAEASYSLNRLTALAEEWSSDYPNLIELALFLKKLPSKFRLSEVKNHIETGMLDFLVNPSIPSDYIRSIIEEKFDSGDTVSFMQEMFKILFRVGVIGVKLDSFTSVSWDHLGHRLMSAELTDSSTVHVHPAFWRVLGTRPV